MLIPTGTYALPGGHLDFGESFEQCAAREVKEETGLNVQDVRFLTATNTVFGDAGKHYVTIFMTAMVVVNIDGSVPEPQALQHTSNVTSMRTSLISLGKRLEPDRCEGWSWCTFTELRKMPAQEKKLFEPLHSLMEQRPDICASLETLATA
ncbi:hypothetical protein LTR91_012546 [Friedmanniomyces endolithicus]|uniref:Nudix hydrolase domain-containing protein n=1 Tax=Friedmanniomyces endolithicus TaxID=329885 RepID=A0AAN6KFI0_9PEZI|nr:hypothetical protein LTR94_003461 [Friedmanniomyces endolithicus]KAK0925169.1 hypothetical protein LTR57_005156 [Friedmanniomyces endolithicus]KAK0979640.1 hypothetical protein LTR91_012546 [Friedmanniomyces endolithicus]KAK0988793.1 hypothetical protein LTS01_009062 [Friedmanniomyces endolithicus]KAK1037712.1 hypothetical protein LTS16_012620 [Friedmanniomyces endolithicus]